MVVTWVDVTCGAADSPITSSGTLICCELASELELAFILPYTSTIAGPTVTVSLEPSMPFGSLGSDWPVWAAAVAALPASNVNTATAFGIAA